MSATEELQNSDKSLSERGRSRYDASLRLSVAPMRDWTDDAYIFFSNNKLNRTHRTMLYWGCGLTRRASQLSTHV